MDFLYILIAILLISFLVLVHEIGHYTAARLTGVPVIEFAIGFGKKLISRKSKKTGILYSLRLFPFGGYVAFADSNDENGIQNYYKVPVWKRLVTTVSGPLMNFVVAFLILVPYVLCNGIPKPAPIVGAVNPGSPAEVAGMKLGDRFITVNGVDVGNDVERLRSAINETAGKSFDVQVRRDGENVSLVITPVLDEATKRNIIGISIGTEIIHVGFGEAISFSANMMVSMVGQLLDFLKGLVTQGKGFDQMASPIGIGQVMVQSAQQYGLQSFIDIAIFLSVNLGLFNLLPLPALDGSKVIFLAIEAIRRKPVPPEKEGIITAVGFGLFILLFIFLAGRDIARLAGWVK